MDTIEKNRKMRRKKIKNNTEHRNINIKNFFSVIFLLGSIGIFILLTLLYGPWGGFRDWLVTTAMTTMTHQYFATWFYDDDVIEYILANNKVHEIKEDTNIDLIKVEDDENFEIPTTFANQYEEQVIIMIIK